MDNQPQKPSQTSEEIDLGQLFQMFRRGLNRIFRGILRIFLYLKKNALILGSLILLGLAIGYLLNVFVDKKLKSEVIVMPNFESKDYLYDVVEEIQSNIQNKDTLFFNTMDIDINGLRAFEITIEPIDDEEEDQEKIKMANDYLEILKDFEDNDFVLDVVKTELLKKTILTHRITFSHKNPVMGEEYVSKILEYINDNPYFKEFKKVAIQNAKLRIDKNTELIRQVDDIVMNFNKKLATSGDSGSRDGIILLETERGLNLPALLQLKNELTKEIEQKQLELVEHKDAINIVNQGKTQIVKKQFLNKSLLWLPAIFVGLFFAWSLVLFLNRKAKEII
ncbi:hypothetical protein [Maribacter halichondriae]|uniref:hypothetical protein n=1 Tax=Maribacter halichondriae TaxID=2980554 RepID=UPI0023593A17|nr:hypothetical protein [Maribacter sp. Hal144]